MREIRSHGSEGRESEINRTSLPLSGTQMEQPPPSVCDHGEEERPSSDMDATVVCHPGSATPQEGRREPADL